MELKVSKDTNSVAVMVDSSSVNAPPQGLQHERSEAVQQVEARTAAVHGVLMVTGTFCKMVVPCAGH